MGMGLLFVVSGLTLQWAGGGTLQVLHCAEWEGGVGWLGAQGTGQGRD